MSAQRVGPKKLHRIERAIGEPVLRGWAHGGYTHGFVTPDHHHGWFNIASSDWGWHDNLKITHYTSCRETWPDEMQAIDEQAAGKPSVSHVCDTCVAFGGPYDGQTKAMRPSVWNRIVRYVHVTVDGQDWGRCEQGWYEWLGPDSPPHKLIWQAGTSAHDSRPATLTVPLTPALSTSSRTAVRPTAHAAAGGDRPMPPAGWR